MGSAASQNEDGALSSNPHVAAAALVAALAADSDVAAEAFASTSEVVTQIDARAAGHARETLLRALVDAKALPLFSRALQRHSAQAPVVAAVLAALTRFAASRACKSAASDACMPFVCSVAPLHSSNPAVAKQLALLVLAFTSHGRVSQHMDIEPVGGTRTLSSELIFPFVQFSAAAASVYARVDTELVLLMLQALAAFPGGDSSRISRAHVEAALADCMALLSRHGDDAAVALQGLRAIAALVSAGALQARRFHPCVPVPFLLAALERHAAVPAVAAAAFEAAEAVAVVKTGGQALRLCGFARAVPRVLRLHLRDAAVCELGLSFLVSPGDADREASGSGRCLRAPDIVPVAVEVLRAHPSSVPIAVLAAATVVRLCTGLVAVSGQDLATELTCVPDSGLLALLVETASAHQTQQSVVECTVSALWALGEAAHRSPQLSQPVRHALAAAGARAAMEAWWVAHAGDAGVCETSIGALLRLHVVDPLCFPLGEAELLRAGEAVATHGTEVQLVTSGMQLWSRAVSEGSKRERWARLLAPGEPLLASVVRSVGTHVTAAPNFPLLSSFCAVAGFLAESEAGADALLAAGALEVMTFGMREALAAVDAEGRDDEEEEEEEEEEDGPTVDPKAARRYLRAVTLCAASSPAACSSLLRIGAPDVVTRTLCSAFLDVTLLRLTAESRGTGILHEVCAFTAVLACAPGGDEALVVTKCYDAVAKYWRSAYYSVRWALCAEGGAGAASAKAMLVRRGAHDKARLAVGRAAWQRRRHLALLRAKRSAAAEDRCRSERAAAAVAAAGAGAT